MTNDDGRNDGTEGTEVPDGSGNGILALDWRDWKRVLCVVAHPDDTEYGISAAVNAWTRAGVEVSYLLLTAGEAGMKRDPAEVGPLRAEEQRAACECVGVDDLVILDHPDGHLVEGLDLRRDIARRIRQVRPDAVVTLTFEFEAPHGLNQADHRAAGRAAIDAARDAGNRWIFREQVEEEGLEPWGGVGEVWAFGSPRATHAVDTTDTFDAGVASLRAHRAYIEGLGWEDWDPAEFLEGMARATGQRLGVRLAAAFEVFPMGWGS